MTLSPTTMKEQKKISIQYIATKWLYWPHPGAKTPDPWTMNFMIKVEGFMDIRTLHLVFLKYIWE